MIIDKQRIREIIHNNGTDENGLSNALYEIIIEHEAGQRNIFANLATKDDIKDLKNDIKDDIGRMIEFFNKRFDDTNKRFDDMNKRITFTQWLIVILFTAYTGIIIYVNTWVLPHLFR